MRGILNVLNRQMCFVHNVLAVARNTNVYVCHKCVVFVLQKEQANFLMKIGALKGALDVFLRLHMWEDVIKCYKNLGQTRKGKIFCHLQKFKNNLYVGG